MGTLSDDQKEELIKRLTEVSSEIMKVPQEFFVMTIKEVPDKNLGKAQGWSDSPLTNHGKKTAMELGLEIKGTIFHAAYASDTLRAGQTAELILSISGNSSI